MDLEPDLSILNPEPAKLEGPNLLHDLVTRPCQSKALEHLEDGLKTSFTYDDLHRHADAVASRLSRVEGYRDRQFVVPVLIEQSPILYAILLGIVKSGGAFCPLNIDAPPERVNFILKDVSAKAVLVSMELATKIPRDCPAEIIIAEDGIKFAGKPLARRYPAAKDLAYVMYTSGSTGTPKGVGLSHAAVTQALLAHERHMPSFSRFLQFAAPTFDVSVFEIFFPLIRGSTLVSVRRSEMLNDLAGVMREMSIDACELTPTVAGSLLRKRKSVPRLKVMLTIGEMLTEPVIREFGGNDEEESILWAMYGPTEATIHCTLQTSMSANSTVRNIGLPLDTVSCFIIRPTNENEYSSFEILPRGQTGELAVGGHQLATEYLNRPEQTDAAFIYTSYGRLYRTGDKARLLPNGTLECLGRLSDGQVKVRGQRLELGEVQEAVLRTPGCHGTVVVVQDSILVAFCATDSGVLEDAILEQCQKWLPRFMIPGEVVLMDSFPKLPSGKVNRRKLVADFVECKHNTETTAGSLPKGFPSSLMSTLAEVLGPNVNAQTPLLSAGLDSLKAITLASSLRSAGFQTEAAMLLRTKTASDLWLAIQSTSPLNTEAPCTPDISLSAQLDHIIVENPLLSQEERSVQDVILCTSLQSSMLAETARQPDLYWNEVELEAEAGVREVKAAFHSSVRANQVLRTGFFPWKDKFAAVVFNELDQEQISIVDSFEPRPPSGEDPLRTLRVQIKSHDSGRRSQVLIHIHHAIYDGWSMDMLLADLSAIIQGSSVDERPQFDKLTQFYQSTAANEKLSTKAFWADHLGGWTKDPFPKLLDCVPNESQPVATRDFLQISVPQVEASSRELGCSVQVFFQASLAIIWSGVLGSTDIVFGTVTSGRALPVAGIEKIMGPCISPLPLRVDLLKMSETSHLLNHIQSTNRAMMEHSALPLSDIKKLTEVKPGESLYDVLFVYQQSLLSDEKEKMPVKELRHLDRLETKLLIEVEPRQDKFVIQATHHPDSMSKDMVSSLVYQFKAVFTQIFGCLHDSPMSLKPSLPAYHAIWNNPPAHFDGKPDLASLFESTVAKTPKAQALCFAKPDSARGLETETMSYQQLNILSNRIAHFLLSGGMGTRQVVGIIMEKSAMLYASILAIVKAGCAYLPLLPSTPIDRVRDIFGQAKVRHCLVDTASFRTFKAVRDVRLVDVEIAPLSNFQDHNLDIPADGDRLAYVIYTSGTTGTPKGVAITQLNITSNVQYLNTVYPKSAGKQSRLLQACSQAFDVSVFEIFYAWHAGMCLCAGINDTIFEDLEHAIRQLQITHLSLTPTVASIIKPENTPTVHFLVTAGEPMAQAVLDRWGGLLWQGYGPSETTNICSVKKMKTGLHIEHLGWTFPNTSVFVLSPSCLDLLPFGWVGEFCFGGDQIAQGYLNMPQTTAERFVNHPKYGRMYRSGDIGRMLPDGSLVILGRIDDQLKLRGQRIEAGEISSTITSTRAANSAVTILGRRQAAVSDQLVSFYVLPEDTPGDGVLDIDSSTTRLLFSVLQSRLPPYMIPSYLIPLARIPLTPSGKLHRSRLQEWFKDLPSRYLEAAALPSLGTDQGGQLTQTESLIAKAIADTMEISVLDVKRWTPFANLGIDSVTAIGLASRLGEQVGRKVPISSIIRNPTIGQLGQCLDDNQGSTPSPARAESLSDGFVQSIREEFVRESKTVEDVLPCTPLQEAMLSGGQQSYYNRIMLRLQINSDEMREYWREMARRHEILRTCFATTPIANRAIAQVVLETWEIPWTSFDVTTPSFDAVVHEHLQTLLQPIDTKTPPYSLAILRYRGSSFLSFICHHALYDGVAMDNLWREVEALANGISLPPPVSYRPFLREILSLPEGVENFWEAQLHGFRGSYLFAPSAARNIDQAAHTKSLRIPLDTLQERVKGLGVALIALCQGAWAGVLAAAYCSPDVCFGNVVSGRNVDIEGVERLVAPCFNTLPIRADLSTKTHGSDLVKHFHQLNSAMLPYQFTPLRTVQKLANRQGRGLFETLLLLQKPLHEMDDKVWILEGDSGDMDVPLVCEVVPCPSLNTVVVNMHYDMKVVDPTSATAVLDVFEHVVESILDSPYASIPNREALPPELREGLQGFRVRQEKPVATEIRPTSAGDWTYVELEIRQVLTELSQQPLSKISRHTTIFQLGLDSINAVQVASRLRRGGLDVSASDVIEFPSCSKLADYISRTGRRTDLSTASSYDLARFAREVSLQLDAKVLSDLRLEAILPCTPMQCAMITSFVQSDGRDYFNSLTYEVGEHVKSNDFINAWDGLVRAHPMLRTALVPVKHPHTAFAMLRYSPGSTKTPLTHIGPEDTLQDGIEAFEQVLRDKIVANPHMLPWHVLVQQTNGLRTMTLFIHHALYDAHSIELLFSWLFQNTRHRDTSGFCEVEPGLSDIMSRSLGDHSEASRFWKDKAQSAVVNSFPVMTPRRETDDRLLVESSMLAMSFPELQSATRIAGVSIQAAIQATWTRILSSYLGESSVVFGVTLSGRNTEATRDAPFPCLVTLPVVASNSSSNAKLLEYMMEYNTQVHKAQFAPLSQVQKWLGHPASPVFDTLISYRRTTRLPSSQGYNLVSDNAAINYPLSIDIEAGQEDVRLSVIFKPNTLPRDQAKFILQQFDANLLHLASHPSGTEDELHREAPNIFSKLPPSIPIMDCPVQYVHQFVEARARSHPDTIALEFIDAFHTNGHVERRTWTYQQLDKIGNQVAHLLSTQAPVNSIVAVHFTKCPEAYFSILGILKAGCSFVALDPTAPEARKSFILRDSQAQCILTGDQDELGFGADETCAIRISEAALRDFSTTPRVLDATFTANSTCYCLYTSGTTGTPKGCEITHENAVQAMMAFQELFRGHWNDESRWLQFAALHFDVSVLEQYWSWCVGITVVAASKDMILDDLTGSINKLGITHIDLTPSLARLTHPDEVPSLCKGVFITGGESLKQEILDAWGPKAVIYNAYGPTEATIGVTMYQRVPINGRPSNIGRQFPNVGSYVLRPGTEVPVLRGGVGELCVSGKLVGKGYLGRPELTEERFPTLDYFQERVYRTGDLVRVLYDGCFDFLGRSDDQVKLRGQRLEIGEINHAIRSVPEIVDAATIVTSHGSSDKDVLISFIVAHQDDRSQDLKILQAVDGLDRKAKEACYSRLPGYMVPTYCFRLPYIPLSVNNKAEFKELKRLFTGLSHEELMNLVNLSSSASADSGTVKRVIRVLAEFANLTEDNISQEMSIFDLGVDSISALRFSSLLKDSGFVEATPAKVLRNPVVGNLAWVLCQGHAKRQSQFKKESQQRIRASGHRYVSLTCRELGVSPSDIEYIAPCSPLQHGIISKAFTLEGKGAYFNSFELRLNAELQCDHLRDAWDDLIASEPILRTVFLATSSGHVQVALKQRPIPWEKLTANTEAEVEAHLRSQKQKWVLKNDMHITEPLQLIHVQTPKASSLYINIFHSIYDGNSFDLMLSRIASSIGRIQPARGPSFLEALSHGPLGNFDYCQPFWSEHLHDWLPSSTPALSSSGSHGASIGSRVLPGNKISSIRKSQNVTFQAVALALWISVFQQYHPSGLTIGTVVSGRSIDLPGVERTIGPLFNTIPFFNKTLAGHTWTSLIQKCHDFGVSVLPFQHVPLQKIQKWCTKGRPLFDTLFTLQLEQDGDEAHQCPWEVRDDELSPDYPLAIEMKSTTEGMIHISLVAQQHVADEPTLESILSQVEEHLDLMATQITKAVPVRHVTPNTNEMATHVTNDIQLEAPGFFQWTASATSIREEVAALAGVEVGNIWEATSMLELGLDSIDIVKLSSKLRTRGIDIAASQIMRLQTIAGIAELAADSHEQFEPAGADLGLGDVKARIWDHLRERDLDMSNIQVTLPSTALQESMVAAMVESEFEWYFNHDVLEVQEDVDMDRLVAAWNRVVEALPILRTGFIQVEESGLDMTFCQLVYYEQQPWREDVIGKDLAEANGIIGRSKARANKGGAQSELFQLSILTTGSRRYLVVSIAHALYDGWSLGLMYREVQKAYSGIIPTTTDTESLFGTLLGSRSATSEEFWEDYLQDAASTFIPKLSEDTSNSPRVFRAEEVSSISTERIQAFCKRHSISLQALSQGCWAMVVAQLTKQLDTVFGVVMSGRDFEGAENLVFPTMNTVAVRCILHGTSVEFLQYMEENLRDIRQHQSYPLRKAQQAAKAPAVGLFNSLFLLQKPVQEESSGSLLRSVKGESAVDYPVCVEAETVGDGHIWRTACHSQFISERGASELIGAMDQVMRFFMESPSSEVLFFSDNHVSICGLRPVILRLDESDGGVATEMAYEMVGWNPTSITIRDTLAQVSGIPESEITLSHTLYHLGLDSISAIKVSSLLRRRGIDLSPRELVAASSILNVAEIAHKKQHLEKPSEEETYWEPPRSLNMDELLAPHGLSMHDLEVVLPALPMQVYMLGTWQNTHGKVFYPEFTYILEYPCEKDAIYAAWETVVKSTPMLRTCFVATADPDQPVLQVIPKANNTASLHPMVEFKAEWQQKHLVWILHLKIHHALYDGVSLPVIVQNLASTITRERGETAQDDKMDRWIRHSTSATLESARAKRKQFWTNYLTGCSQSLGSGVRTGYPIERVSHIERSAIPDSTGLRRQAARLGLSVQSLFLAAYAKVLLSREGLMDRCDAAMANPHGTPPVVFGIYLANRGGSHHGEGLPDSYPCLNLVPLRVDTCGSTLEVVAAAIQRDLAEINAGGRADVGLWEVDAWTGTKISSFVNFLSLPDAVDEGSPMLKPVEGLAQPECSSETTHIGEVMVKDSFPPAIDVEASLRNDGLDIGVFGPSNLLADEVAAAGLITEIVAMLQYNGRKK